MNWWSSGPHYLAELTFLTGKNKNHVEVNTGITAFFDSSGYHGAKNDARFFNKPVPSKSIYYNIGLAAGIGYRFQKPDGGLVFRTGLVFPESVYLSLGYLF